MNITHLLFNIKSTLIILILFYNFFSHFLLSHLRLGFLASINSPQKIVNMPVTINKINQL